MKVAIIPARGGSKRIPRKNIRPFHGKPMMAWPIAAAQASGCFDRILVSTDDPEIAEVARACGAEAPFVRPPELSNDMIGTTPVVRHAVQWLSARGPAVTQACCIYATAAFLRGEDLRQAHDRLQAGDCAYVFSATTFPFPVQRALRLLQGNRVEPLYPEHIDRRSQDLEHAIHDAGQFYWGLARSFLEELPIFARHSAAWMLPRHRVQDIDSMEDWDRAELMHRALQGEGGVARW